MAMASSKDQHIEYFQALTGWKDRQKVIDFLQMYEWDVTFAAEAFLTNSEVTKDDQSHKPILFRTNSREVGSRFKSSDDELPERKTLFEARQQQISNNSMERSSHPSFNSRNYQLTTNNSNQIIPTSHTQSADERVIQLYKLNGDGTNPKLRDINQLKHNKQELLQYIDSNVIGRNLQINTPWGSRKIVYADYTASGRGLTFVEYCMMFNVLPYYANTHSENNACALHTTKFREGARTEIKRCVNATNDDVVIFTGSGSTAAINKLVDVLQLRNKDVQRKTVVFISTFEHHSNILPWSETGIEVIRIPNTKEGLIDRDNLKKQLKHYHNIIGKHIICTFNAASNVTGIQTDVDRISTLVHQYDGWVFWDYAAGAPYLKIDMNPSETAYKDAVFISVHKFVGGPATPGLLIAKKKLFNNPVPSGVGGGTVTFVTRTRTVYVKDIEAREEGGTPNILGAIRAGLVFHLKEIVGYDTIEKRENELVAKFFARFRNHRKLIILGSTSLPRLGIFSFLLYVPFFAKYLHHNFVCVLLNDLFGIQVRSGCACAGPYVLDLLKIDDKTVDGFAKFITADENGKLNEFPKNALVKPGFTRFNLSYFASDKEVDYILNAVEFIAHEGWKFLSLYTYDINTAVWHPRPMPSKNHFSQFHNHQIANKNRPMKQKFENNQVERWNSLFDQSNTNSSSDDPIEEAKLMASSIPKYVYENIDFRADPPLNVPDGYEDFIWFVLPKEVIRKIVIDFEQNQRDNYKPVPFHLKMKN
ncbi:unnamed protein product [Rotaria sp. Silwood1]|nr:unnamed protein product [Rotaria sp. Silwood1]CAF4724396.1 unnamed protein product [Rotaria sp. Silwood1]